MFVAVLLSTLGFSNPDPLVEKALKAELAGDASARAALLAEAAKGEKPSPEARWLAGEVFDGKAWRKAANYEGKSPGEEFLKRQAACPLTAADHWKLAKWCRAKGLKAEYLAELQVVVWLDPTAAEAQRALGRKLYGNVWRTPAEQTEARAAVERATAIDREWTLKLKALPTPPDSVPAIQNPLAIPAFEREVSRKSEKGARLVVQQLKKAGDAAAVHSLVRHAVLSDFASVRKDAAEALRDSSLDYWFVDLCTYLRSNDSGVTYGLGIGPTWYWQDFESTHVRKIELTTGVVPRHGSLTSIRGDSDVGVVQGESRMNAELFRRSSRFEQNSGEAASDPIEAHENFVRQGMERAQIKSAIVSQRASEAFQAAAGFDPKGDFQAAARWFAQMERGHIDEDSLPTRETTVETTTVRVNALSDCFASGTPVWTERGLVAIDRIQLGDRVLSQNEKTGELAYRPVVSRTLFGRVPMRKIESKGDSVLTTKVHALWKVGEGWRAAGTLSTGDRVRSVSGPVVVDANSEAAAAQAYNLEVAEFATFFVGKTGLLVHDRSPTVGEARPLPGMPASK